MITSVSNTADLLTTPRQGSEPDNAATERPTAARTQPGSTNATPDPIDQRTLDQAVAKVSEVLKKTDTNLKIEVDEDSKRVIVKILREDSGEVIRQFPPKEVLELAKYLDGSKGVLLEEQA
jgi:flagellar protein FlaG